MRMVIAVLLTISVAVSAQDKSRWYEVSGGLWSVSTSTAEEIVPLLQSAANRESERMKFIAPNLETYTIQYQGVVSGVDRLVAVRGACKIFDEAPASLSNKWYLNFDGSECYFGAIYDPATKQLKVFSFFGTIREVGIEHSD